jgi:hypothetical protein
MWFLARPYGRLQLRGTFLSLWDDILPVIPEWQWRENLALVAAWLADFGGRGLAEPPHIQWQSPGTIDDPTTGSAMRSDRPADLADIEGGSSNGSRHVSPVPPVDDPAVATRDLSASAALPRSNPGGDAAVEERTDSGSAGDAADARGSDPGEAPNSRQSDPGRDDATRTDPSADAADPGWKDAVDEASDAPQNHPGRGAAGTGRSQFSGEAAAAEQGVGEKAAGAGTAKDGGTGADVTLAAANGGSGPAARE